MSLVHHEPDITVVPCLCCDELIDLAHLVQFKHHRAASCCFWHPYHFWCIRGALPAPREPTHCADCGGAFDEPAIDAIAKWALTSSRRVHRRTINATPPKGVVHDRPENIIPIPDVGLRLVEVWWPPGVDRSTKKTPPHGVLSPREVVERDYEVVHETCADPWLDKLRADRADNDLRTVYADHLEQLGDRRADFVRIAIRYRTANDLQARLLRDPFFEARAAFPSGWVRDVVRAY